MSRSGSWTASDLAGQLIAHGHRIPTAHQGLWNFGADHERIVAGLTALLDQRCAADTLTVTPPPLQPLASFDLTNYVSSFPQLTGVVHTFGGGQSEFAELLATRERGEDWQHYLGASQLAQVPAICQTIYPMFRDQVVDQTIRASGWCFRHEPSEDPMRLVAFRMGEIIRLGSEEETIAHREAWLGTMTEILTNLGLDVTVDVANDPFFGRAGRILASGQRSEALKFEVLSVVHGDQPTALASGNAHRTHFSEAFNFTLADGSIAHTSCAGLGLERTAAALLARHGMVVADWPGEVRGLLGL